MDTIVKPPESERTVGKLFAGFFVGAFIYALAGGFAAGALAGLWAATGENSETQSEAGGWAVGGALIGAIAFSIVGAAVGLIARTTGRWPRRPWMLPLVGAVLAAMATGAGWSSTDSRMSRLFWPLIGLLAGNFAHVLFREFVAPRQPDTPG